MNQDELPLGHRIAPEMLAHIEDASRRIPEGERDDFFRQVTRQAAANLRFARQRRAPRLRRGARPLRQAQAN